MVCSILAALTLLSPPFLNSRCQHVHTSRAHGGENDSASVDFTMIFASGGKTASPQRQIGSN